MTNPHFAWLPPEINSALMYAGPGTGPLLAAAAAWDSLASELHSSATSFGSVTSDLAGSAWQGPSATAMMAVANEYMGYLGAVAANAEAAATGASEVAAAFESAQSATVQPAVVAANRALGHLLANTNWLGQNAPAIADIEAAYEQMWALDVAAMAAYHSDASGAAQQLAPWRRFLHGFSTGRFGTGQSGVSGGDSGTVSSASTDGTLSSGGSNSGSGFGGDTGLAGLENATLGLLNSHTGNLVISNPGLNNRIWNSGTGNVGLAGRLWNSGVGFGNLGSPDTSLFNSTGGIVTAKFSPSIFNSVATGTGGFNPGVASTSMLNSVNGVATGAPSPSGAAGADSSGPSPRISAAAANSSGAQQKIPSSGFFDKLNRVSGDDHAAVRQPSPAD